MPSLGKCCAVHQSNGRMHADPIHDTCQNAATVERNGRPYCKRHDPEAKEARAEAKRLAAILPNARDHSARTVMHAEWTARYLRELGNEAAAQQWMDIARSARAE